MPGRIPAHWKDRPSEADLRARDARERANERFLAHARVVHGIQLDGHLIVQRTGAEHAKRHNLIVGTAIDDHDRFDHYIPK